MAWEYMNAVLKVLYGLYGMMAVVFAVLLVHILRGNKSKWLILVTTLILISNAANSFFGFLQLSEIYLQAGLIAIYFGTFGVSHAMLAFKYKRLVRTVPEILLGHQATPQTTCDKRWEQTLLVLNSVVPLIYIVYDLLEHAAFEQ
jgi:hypothetical protein